MNIPDNITRDPRESRNEFQIRAHREVRKHALEVARSKLAEVHDTQITDAIDLIIEIIDDILEEGFV